MSFWAAAAVVAVHPIAVDSAKSKSGGGSPAFLLVLALLAVAFYFFVLRPQRTRMRKTQQQQQDLAVGTTVMTGSGLYGTVAAVEDDAVLIEVAPGVTTRWAKGAIGRVVDTPEVLGLDGDAAPSERENPDD